MNEKKQSVLQDGLLCCNKIVTRVTLCFPKRVVYNESNEPVHMDVLR